MKQIGTAKQLECLIKQCTGDTAHLSRSGKTRSGLVESRIFEGPQSPKEWDEGE